MALSVSVISDVGVGFLSLFAGFPKRIAPPEGTSKLWTGFASVIAGVTYLGVKVLTQISSSPGSVKFWGFLALCSIVLSVTLCFFYISARQTYTVEYAGGLKIAGTEHEYTVAAQTYLRSHQNLTRAQVLFDFTGDAGQVWTSEALMKARAKLGGFYSLFIACLAFGLYLAVDVAQVGTAQPKPYEVQTTPLPPFSSQGDGKLVGLLADLAADAIRTTEPAVKDVAQLPTVASQEFVKGLSGEAGKKLTDGFADLIATGFKPSSDRKKDGQILRTLFVREIVRTTGPSGPPLMEERIYFEIGQTRLTSDAYSKIGHIRDFVASYPNYIILLRANADTLGSVTTNETLARKRSAIVRGALVSAGGIASNRIFAADLGNDSLPTITPRSTPEQQNRSVTIEVRKLFP